MNPAADHQVNKTLSSALNWALLLRYLNAVLPILKENMFCFTFLSELQLGSAQKDTMAESSESKAEAESSASRDTEKDCDTKRCSKSCCPVMLGIEWSTSTRFFPFSE